MPEAGALFPPERVPGSRCFSHKKAKARGPDVASSSATRVLTGLEISPSNASKSPHNTDLL